MQFSVKPDQYTMWLSTKSVFTLEKRLFNTKLFCQTRIHRVTFRVETISQQKTRNEPVKTVETHYDNPNPSLRSQTNLNDLMYGHWIAKTQKLKQIRQIFV